MVKKKNILKKKKKERKVELRVGYMLPSSYWHGLAEPYIGVMMGFKP